MMWKVTLIVSPEALPIYVKRLLPYPSLAASPQWWSHVACVVGHVEDGGALDEPEPASELAVLQHGQPVHELPALAPELIQQLPTGHALPAAVPSWWPTDEDPTGKEEVPLFRLSCKQDWQGTIHTKLQVYFCDTKNIWNGPSIFFPKYSRTLLI